MDPGEHTIEQHNDFSTYPPPDTQPYNQWAEPSHPEFPPSRNQQYRQQRQEEIRGQTHFSDPYNSSIHRDRPAGSVEF